MAGSFGIPRMNFLEFPGSTFCFTSLFSSIGNPCFGCLGICRDSELYEEAVNPGTTSRLTKRECLYGWFRRRTHKLHCPVTGRLSQGQPDPEQSKTFMFMFSERQKAHKHKQMCGVVPGLGGKILFVCVCVFRSFLMGEKIGKFCTGSVQTGLE